VTPEVAEPTDVVDDRGAPLDAGRFSEWLRELDAALQGDDDARVPCGTCRACCTSAQFVHIGPDETDTLAHVPRALCFPAPGLPVGHVVLGYDERGWCPMLGEHGCTIYEHRPRTCRTYDCRVFAAAGVTPADDQPDIAARVRRWRFTVDDEATWVDVHDAVPDDGSPLGRSLHALGGVLRALAD
jgi:hypothetical protein